jgi:UDP-N-acetylglucosamine--N-acetylmuramyl-(pentapeptide) pyrophosphoryl-undecaprenol N-acetylglucosamine transferase
VNGLRLLIAGGGTGGHLFPGIAVAEEVRARGGEVLFVGTARGLEVRLVPAAGFPLELIDVSGLKRVGAVALVRGLVRLPLALTQSLGLVRRFRPDVVLGVGGYASGPLVMAAALARRPTALLEQNSVPGFTNRTLGRFVRRAFIAFPEAAASFPRAKVVATGNPVRRAFLDAAARVVAQAKATATATTHGGPRLAGPGGLRLMVVGGSQGARAVNDLVLGAMAIWAGQGNPPPLTHQTGAGDADRVAAAYAGLGLGAAAGVDVRPFLDDMVGALAAADLVIARAGAMTLAELAILGKPAILVPLPTAADDHQSRNAAAFAEAGAAVVLPQPTATAAALATLAREILDDPQRQQRMAAAMRALGRPGAAKEIVEGLAALRA